MKRISMSVLCNLLMLLFFCASVPAFDATINGTAQFECNLLSKYMEKHGYFFIRELHYKNNIKTNLFAAGDAEVIIKNKYNTVMGVGKTDKQGNFSISVPRDNNYKVVVRFHDRQVEDVIEYSEAEDFIADLGYFETEKVGSWIEIPPLSYCDTCNIRILEEGDPF